LVHNLHTWPSQVLKHITARDDENSIRSYISDKVTYFQDQCRSCDRDLAAQISICPPTITTSVIDVSLKQFVISRQKSLSTRITAEMANIKASVREKQLLSILSSDLIQDEQRAIINRIISLRQSQLKVLEELWILERRILIGILPPIYDKIDQDLGPTNTLSTVYHGRSAQEITNEYKKMVKASKRNMLQNEIRHHETVIENYDHKLQYELLMFKRHFPDTEGSNNPLIESMKAYIRDRTEQALRNMSTDMTKIRIRLTRRLRSSSTAKNAIKVSPEVIIDAPDVPLNYAELNYLARGPSYIRPNQTAFYSSKKKNKEISREHANISGKILSYLNEYHHIPRTQSISLRISNDLKTSITRRHRLPLSTQDRLRARTELKLVKSIRRKLKKANLVLQVTDKSGVFYIGRAIDFNQKAVAYRIKTEAYAELPSNPLKEVYLKVVQLIKDLHLKKVIRKWQYKKMLPDHEKTRLAHMYFLPKAHKEGTPLRPIISSIRAPTTGISRLLDELIRPIFEENVEATTITDGVDLITRLEMYSAQRRLKASTRFCTFDITDLYTMLPQKEALDALENFLKHFGYNQVAGIPIGTIRQLAELVLTENVFVYDKKYYRQILGGAMGSPFTLTLANIFMWEWEARIAKEQQDAGEVYGRYIDDVFFTWNKSLEELYEKLKTMNSWHPKIKLVHQVGFSVSFLDVLVSNDDGVLSTSVYHKAAAEPQVVPYSSDHPRSVFDNIVEGALLRATRYSSTLASFDDERCYLRLKLLYNGYPPKYIGERFKNFFAKNLVSFPSLQLSSSIILAEDFRSLREHLLQKRSIIQSKRLKRITKAKMTTAERELANEKYREIANTRLIIHMTHENRLGGLKKDIHQIWSESFAKSTLNYVRFIIGNRNRRNSKLELVNNEHPPSMKKLQTTVIISTQTYHTTA